MAKYGTHLALLLSLFCGCAGAQCIPGGMAVIVNKANPVESLSMAQLRKLILGDARTWQNNKNVAPIARDPNTKDFQCASSPPSFVFRSLNTIATSSAPSFVAMIPWPFKPWILTQLRADM